jgi:hypothetical protein
MCVVYWCDSARLRSVPSEPTGIEYALSTCSGTPDFGRLFYIWGVLWVCGVLVDVDLIHTVVGGHI